MKLMPNFISGAVISLASLLPGCFPQNRYYVSYSGYSQPEAQQPAYVQQENPYLWERNPNYAPDCNPLRNNSPHVNPERRMWRENAYTPRTVFRSSEQIERHILEETRGADFNNPVDRRHSQIRAQQIREEAWRRQTAEWNKELNKKGYTRKRN
ncbi:MAG: hypothetical protein KKB21_02550 [Nanoarchaeota archaeon]|nr:hypothetical protein [Nanoarchaeota archaeon]MBU4086436.1 hypothetical protein [Nanoarchaeota archaeon]